MMMEIIISNHRDDIFNKKTSMNITDVLYFLNEIDPNLILQLIF